MRSSPRTEFIGRIKKALARTDSVQGSLAPLLQNKPTADDSRRLKTIADRNKVSRLALLERLSSAAEAVNVRVIAEPDGTAAAAAIGRIAADQRPEWDDRKSVVAWNHPLVNTPQIRAGLKALDIPAYFAEMETGKTDRQAAFRHRAAKALIGITSADYGLAQTATLAMKSRPGQPRCVSLLPSVHIAVIRLEQLLADLKELYTLLKWNPADRAEGLTRCLTLITGPSKTADIEATLVHGAHGPRDLTIVVLTG